MWTAMWTAYGCSAFLGTATGCLSGLGTTYGRSAWTVGLGRPLTNLMHLTIDFLALIISVTPSMMKGKSLC
jgi:hypothetical protein